MTVLTETKLIRIVGDHGNSTYKMWLAHDANGTVDGGDELISGNPAEELAIETAYTVSFEENLPVGHIVHVDGDAPWAFEILSSDVIE